MAGLKERYVVSIIRNAIMKYGFQAQKCRWKNLHVQRRVWMQGLNGFNHELLRDYPGVSTEYRADNEWKPRFLSP